MPRVIHTFPVSRLWFVAVDREVSNPHHPSNSGYAVSVPALEVPKHLADMIPDQMHMALNNSLGLLTLRTKIKPAIYGQEALSRDLLPIREFCTATGCTMDRVLRDQPAVVAVTLYEKSDTSRRESPYPDRYGLGLEAIQIDPEKVTIPTWEHITGEF